MIKTIRSSGIARHFWVLTAAALNVFVLYAPQPLLPLFARLYGQSEAAAGLIMTVTMLPLAVAPLSYGYLLSFIQPMKVLRYSLFVLAVVTCLTGMTQTFSQLLVVRFIQGLIIPASLTAVMAFLAHSVSKGGNLQGAMSLYVAATISGGFLGRLLTGMSTVIVDWRMFFFILSGFLLACSFFLQPHSADQKKKEDKRVNVPGISSYTKVKVCLPIYLSIFCLFFVFCGTLNFLPFRTIELSGSRSGLLTGIMYCGYITGIITSMGAGRIVRGAGSEARVMILGYILFLLFLTGMLAPETVILFVLLFPFCGTMFLVHSVATAVVNRKAGRYQTLASGLYVSSYYAGGVFGSFLPGLLFERFGWSAMIVSLVVFGFSGVIMLVVFFRRLENEGVTP